MGASCLRSLRALAAFSLFNYFIVSTFCNDIGLVNIQQGRLMGKVFDTVSKSATFYAFKGIPYAQPPIGALKFMPPKPHPGWEGVRSAFEHGDFCLQADYPSEEGIGAEDCLFLNVYTPTLKHKSLPVMVFIHGGFFREGSGDDTWFGPDYFMDEDVILVTINYRLAVLGFLNMENEKYPGNMGMKDIVLSLKWVKDNIKSFGGDPDKVTIFGQGSGGVAVDLLYLSPIAKGLFHRAILQSGTSLIASYLEWRPRERAFYLSKIMGYDITDESRLLKLFNEIDPAYLQGNVTRTIDVDETIFKQIGIVVFSPALTTEEEGFITKLPEEIFKSGEIPDPTIPIMIGYNSEEGILHNSFYIQRPHFVKTLSKRFPHLFPLRGLFAKFASNYHYEIQYRLTWYYFNETIDPNKPTILKEFLNYMSDEHIIPIDKSVKEYVKVLKAPVYFYRFSYDGGLNYFKAQVTKPLRDKLDQPVAGASEKDELCYLFKCDKLNEEYAALHSAEDEPKDLKTVKRMVRLWTNFAKTGNPTPNEDDSILGDFKWLPVEEGRQNFLDIDEILEVGRDPHGDNVEFWDAMYEYYNPLATDGVLIDKPKDESETETKEKDEFFIRKRVPTAPNRLELVRPLHPQLECVVKVVEEAEGDGKAEREADENGSISATIPDRPVELKNFVKLCEQRRKFPCLYKLDYQTAVKVDTHSCRHATKKTNLDKNQNQKVIPYDYNRVVLNTIEGQPDSDYINASYIDSLLKPNAYIVTQGPTEFTVTQFWRMVWQERAAAIVMLTKTFDFIKVMCVQYWPPSKDKDENYGGIHIGVAQEEELANFHIRTFRLYKKDAEGKVIEERFILQFHYTQWHSHTCPFSNAILEFRRRVRAVVGHRLMSTTDAGPMVVHCNDGGGRSGVYLAIDANMELAEEEDSFDVFGYMKKLRQSRKGLIENIDQYKFVYDTLEEHIVCGVSWFPVKELSQCLKLKAQRDPATRLNSYQREYAQICRQTPRFTIGDCAGGHRGDNREKNRDVLVVPPDNFRPYLTSFQGNSFTDYINAVFVDGYTKPREYIVTEWPLKGTCGEFWSLVYDYECAAVVVLCIPPHSSQQFPAFWPDTRHSKKYGPVFTIDHVSHNHYTNIKTWVFRINKKIVSLTELMAGVKAPPKTVQLFQLTCWPMGHKVPTSTNSLVELMNMVERWRQRTDYGPVCVVSPDGRSRAGVYCAANACIEQVIQHGEVDIFQAVKTVRRHRPQLIENMTEYKYCYDLVLHYVLHYLNKDMKEKK